SSPPWPASATASTQHPAPGVREVSVDRAPGLSVRLKLTLSYAGLLMLAGASLLAAVRLFLPRRMPPGSTFSFLLRDFTPIAGIGAGVPAGVRSAGRVDSGRPDAGAPVPHHGRHTHGRQRVAGPPNPATGPQR